MTNTPCRWPLFGRALFAATLTVLMSMTSNAAAQGYPNRPVKIVVGYSSGGSPDAVSRIMADHFSRVFNQAFIVENRIGASGTLASTFVAQAIPDGYTLLIAETGQLEIAPQLIKLPYDPVDGYSHIGQLTRSPLVIVANAKSPYKRTSVGDLVAAAKARTGKINLALQASAAASTSRGRC